MLRGFSTLIGSCATYQCIVAKGAAALPSEAQHASCRLRMAAQLIDNTKRVPCLHQTGILHELGRGASPTASGMAVCRAHPSK